MRCGERWIISYNVVREGLIKRYMRLHADLVKLLMFLA